MFVDVSNVGRRFLMEHLFDLVGKTIMVTCADHCCPLKYFEGIVNDVLSRSCKFEVYCDNAQLEFNAASELYIEEDGMNIVTPEGNHITIFTEEE